MCCVQLLNVSLVNMHHQTLASLLVQPARDRKKIAGKAQSDDQLKADVAMVVVRDAVIAITDPENYPHLPHLLAAAKVGNPYNMTALDTRAPMLIAKRVGGARLTQCMHWVPLGC